jgi:hypothetical protein
MNGAFFTLRRGGGCCGFGMKIRGGYGYYRFYG